MAETQLQKLRREAGEIDAANAARKRKKKMTGGQDDTKYEFEKKESKKRVGTGNRKALEKEYL